MVDDATRIDASALNTAAAAVGSNGSGLTEAGGTGDHLTGIPSVGAVTGGINTGAGTITTLDGLDTAQDTQHATTQSKVDTAQADLDLLTGNDGATLATSQPNYAPAVAGDQMDLVNAPNATAITAIQAGLATAAKLLAYVQLLARSDSAIATDNATELAEINANGGSGAGDFANASEALEALRDWIGNGTNLTEAGGTGDQLTALPTLAEILAGGDVDGYTIEQALKIILAALAGKLSGAATNTVTVRAADDSKDRITATVDASGNRSAVTLDGAG